VPKDELQALLEEAHGLQTQKRFDDAIDAYRRILSEQPRNWEVVRMYGQCLGDAKRFEESYAVLRSAVSHEPYHPLGHTLAANALNSLGEHIKAGYYYERAIECSPTLREAVWNYALWQIGHGDTDPALWRKGWADYELAKGMNMRPKNHPSPEWDGRYLGPGKRLYIKWEQGAGDTLMFARFVARAKEVSGARVLFEVQEPLVSVLCDMDPVEEVVPWQHGNAFACRFDEHVSLLSLPHILGVTVDEIGNNWHLGLPTRGDKSERTRPKIGVCNRGSAGHSNDHNRSIPWETFRTALANVNADLYYLVPGDAPEGTIPMQGYDFSETAAVIAGMDLIVTVDTSVAHLSGVLGAKTWMLTPCNPDFRWFYDRTDSPWYPSLKLFRQEKYGQWQPELDCINSLLTKAMTTP